jgi:hypothetical protein
MRNSEYRCEELLPAAGVGQAERQEQQPGPSLAPGHPAQVGLPPLSLIWPNKALSHMSNGGGGGIMEGMGMSIISCQTLPPYLGLDYLLRHVLGV